MGKRPGTMYCSGCKDYMKSFKPQEAKITNIELRENLTVLFVDLINQDF